MKYFFSKTREIIWKSDTLFMEFWMALYTCLSGSMFLLGGINSYYSGSVYQVIASVFSQTGWGFTLLALGLLEFYGMYSNKYKIQKWILAIATTFWVFTSCVIGFGNGHSWVFSTVVMVVIAHIWLYLRISRRLRIRNEVHTEVKRIIEHG